MEHLSAPLHVMLGRANGGSLASPRAGTGSLGKK
jgi:hypothetical protein